MTETTAESTHPFSLDHIPAGFAEVFVLLWQRYSDACAATGDASLFEAASARSELPRVWIASEFVATACIRNPQMLGSLIAGGALDCREHGQELVSRINGELAGCSDEGELNVRLRQIRQREMVRMAWRDLSGAGDLEETMEGVSVLAEVCIDQALDFHHDWLGERFGVPRDEQGQPVAMVVLGLGKLGGGELNYSSDIDLMFAYDGAGDTDGQRVINNQEYFIKLGRKLVTSLDQVTAEGFVFRTDMRLRPNGDSGPLVLSFSALEHYYQTHGRGWERYALIKARVVAGDRKAGVRLQRMLNPFIYRKYLDFGAFDSIREMRRLIIRELQKESMQNDIKLGQGGIREIEFLVQSHQLIRGGRERSLQTQSLYQAMQGLVDLGVFTETARSELLQDYRFLRNTEHRLQMAADRQTQRLPNSEEGRLRLAWSMGFESWEQYLQQLNRHRDRVHRAFGEILGQRADGNDTDSGTADTGLTDLWQGVLEETAAIDALVAAGFTNPESVPSLLRQFRSGRLYQAFSGLTGTASTA